MTHAVPNKNEVYVTADQYHERYIRLYGNKLVRRVKSLRSLKPGDIYIINEGVECPVGVPEGVHLFVWLLAHYRGCTKARFISHNHFLTTFEGIRLPKERIIHPYLSIPIVEQAVKLAGLSNDGSISYRKSQLKSKKNIVLIDDDCPYGIMDVIKNSARKAGGTAKVLTQMNQTEIIRAYQSAKVVVDWCMRGSERCPLEASLFGVIAMTSQCGTGLNFADFPIPSEFIVPGHSSESDKNITDNDRKRAEKYFTAMFERIFRNYWDYVPLYEPLRRSVLGYNPQAMVSQSIDFLATVHIDEKDPNSILPGGCLSC
jgi:hypothetical protein